MAHDLPGTDEVGLFDITTTLISDREIDKADRFFGRTAVWPGDAGDADTVICAEALPPPSSQRWPHRRANRPHARNQFGRHADQRGLSVIAIGDHTTQKDGRTARHVRNALGYQATSAAFCRRDRLPARLERF